MNRIFETVIRFIILWNNIYNFWRGDRNIYKNAIKNAINNNVLKCCQQRTFSKFLKLYHQCKFKKHMHTNIKMRGNKQRSHGQRQTACFLGVCCYGSPQ